MTKEERKEYLKKYYESDLYKAYNKAKYEANKEKIKKHNRDYYKANKEKMDALIKCWHENNKERLKIKSKAYYEINKEKINAYSKYYYKINKEKIFNNQKISDKKGILNLSDGYCAKQLHLPVKEIPKELIEAKRLQIKILRACRSN